MNSLAVALAADSAATVSDGNDDKIYNSANKLFMLSQAQPVGVMVHSNSSLLGIPWETIIKMFRAELGDAELDTLEQYGEKFIQYLDGNDYLFPPETQKRFYLSLVETLYRGIVSAIEEKIYARIRDGEDITDTSVIAKAEILAAVDQWKAKNDAACFDGQDVGSELAGTLSGEIHGHIVSVFGALQIDTDASAALRELAILVVNKDDILSESLSGVVIAGFGRRDYFPVMQVFELGEVFKGRLKYRLAKSEKISASTPSVVQPFAQAEMVETFLRGISPEIELRMIQEVVTAVVELPDVVIGAISDLTDVQKEHWRDKIRPQSAEALEAFVAKLEKHRLEKHLGPILRAIINLPIDELAHVAASLVNLNLFQKRMSLSPETVGGPIDVAVISKGDGFIWIERKHYFREELNTHYFDRRRRAAPTAKSNEGTSNGH